MQKQATTVSELLYKRLKANGVMLFNAASLVATFCVKAGLGFAYWWVAARQFSPSAVGFASAAISALTLLGTLCMLGFGTLLIRELPKQRGQEVVLISTALILVAMAGACVGLLFALGVPFFSVDLQPLRGSIQAVAIFAVGASLTAVNLVLDQALIGFLRGDLQLWRNILFASAKLVALTLVSFWFAQRTGLSIFITWMIGDAFSLLVLGGYAVIKRKWNGRIALPRWNLLRRMGPLAIQHHLLNLLLIGPNYALPLLVTALLSTTMNAWFYIAFLIADIVYVVPQALVTALYAVSSAQPDVLMRKIRLSMGLALLTCLLTISVLLPASKLLLEIFGSGYADQGVWSMRILGLGAIPFLVKDHYVTICRVQDRIAKTLLPLTYGALLEVGLAIVGAHFGSISGLSLGWVIAVCIEAAFMSPTLYRTAWPRHLESIAGSAVDDTTSVLKSLPLLPCGHRSDDRKRMARFCSICGAPVKKEEQEPA
jgi:O-antigen/teichoic acid export membrane protein